MHPSQALDAQIDTQKWYACKDGRVQLAHQLAAQSGVIAALDDNFIEHEKKHTIAKYFVDLASLPKIHFHRGDCCFVTKDILAIAMQAAEDSPKDFSLSETDLLTRHGFMVFEDGIVTQDVHGKDVVLSGFGWGLEINNTLFSKQSRVVCLWFLTETGDLRDTSETELVTMDFPGYTKSPYHISHYFPYSVGDSLDWPESQLVLGSVNNLLRLFFTLMILSHQPLVENRAIQPTRGTRKREGRWRPRQGYISVITLRHKVVDHGGEKHKIEHQYRCVVGGHWRRQWYPSLQKHQWKYIYEYVKGPEDKPLVVRSKRMFFFRR